MDVDAAVPEERVAVVSSDSSGDEGSGSYPGSCAEGEPPSARVLELASRRISVMRPVSPDVLRATSAGRALRFLARALSQPKGRHHLSFQTERIQCFWSHSWHGSTWKKRLTLIFIYLAPWAAVASTGAAALTAFFFSLKVLLPGFRQRETFLYPKSFWGTGVGALTYLLVLLLARPRTSVFLDAICIHQDDEDMKGKALLSLGAFLKNSESMLVLWDTSWSHRLWCVFELAAYLRSCEQEGKKPNIVIRPTGIGPSNFLQTLALLIVFLAAGLVPDRQKEFLWTMQALFAFLGFYVTATTYRHIFGSLEQVRRELKGFRLEDAKCHCCTKGHASPEELCDRKVMERCIVIWFGSVETFEERVRSDVLACLSKQLDTQLFSYRQCVQGMVPVIWTFMDTGSAQMHFNDHWKNLLAELIRGLAWWLGVVPSAYLIGLRVAYCLRRKRSCWLCEEAMNATVVLSIVAAVVVAVQVEFLFMQLPIKFHHDGLTIELALFCCLMVPVALVLFGCVGTHPHTACE
ncbi:unnamed protein product [Symbiodinium natans]|uniref:Uncharacterized protein n=1 Tax=Symbiodinium natans TaxID=878477 RepID=A0A812RI94_9DINO|nr:unnamed protein product [Symbiodinium natans]